MIEVRCSRELAIWLGAVEPQDKDEHKALRASGDILMRDPATSTALFWPWMNGKISNLLLAARKAQS